MNLTEEPIAPSIKGHGDLILVVDDEAAIRERVGDLLEAYAYQTLRAESGNEALKLLLQYRGSMKLVLTDMMMPGMDGLDLIHALQLHDASVMVVVMSGFDTEAHRNVLTALGVKEILPKPVAPGLLLQTLVRLLPVYACQVTNRTLG
ncbi:MAG: response regulator [Opitutaceae bacterium]|nr:response regulator [Opitutaceae bacterium]